MPVLLIIYAQRKKDGIRELCATKQCQRAMRLFYHYLPCLVSHGDLNSGKAPYVAEFIPDFRLLIGGDRYYRNNQFAVSFIDSKAPYVAEFIPVFRQRIGGNRSFRNNQFAVSFIDSVKHFEATHWRNFSQRCYLRQVAAICESIIPDARNAVRQCQFGQAAATPESTIPDTRHAVGQC